MRDETKEVWGVVYELLENELENLDKDEDFNPGRRDEQNEYTRENHYVWREGDAKRPLLVALYRGHPQPNPPLPDCEYKSLIVEGAKHWQLPADYIQELESIQTVRTARLATSSYIEAFVRNAVRLPSLLTRSNGGGLLPIGFIFRLSDATHFRS